MTRFSSLEFDDTGGQPERPAGEEIRNEGYFYKQAIRYYLHGDFELALRNYSRSLEANSQFLDGWAGQVRMLIELQEYKEAIMWSDKAMELFPEQPERRRGCRRRLGGCECRNAGLRVGITCRRK